MGRVAWVVASLLLLPVAVALAGCSATTSESLQASPSGDVAGGGAHGSNGSAMVQTGGVQTGGGRDGMGGGGVDAYGRVSPKEYVAVVSLDDIYFDFDSYDIRPDAARILEASAAWLKSNPRHLVLIEGHADERGTNEYNIALGERRARSAMNYLVSHGVQARRISRISYGEERGVCGDRTDDCWAKNRRAHFSVKAQ